MAGSTAGLERARASARWFLGSLGMRLLCRAPTSVEWLLGSPRMRRVLAAQSGLVLALGVATVAVDHHSPDLTREPLALVSALPPADGRVSPPAPPAPRPGPGPRRLHRSTTTVPQRRPRSPARPTRTAAPARPTTTVARGWAYWAPRIRFCESSGNYRAVNSETGASGAYQILDLTWGGRFGLQHAGDATSAQQDQAAAELYRAYGTRIWAQSAPCWR